MSQDFPLTRAAGLKIIRIDAFGVIIGASDKMPPHVEYVQTVDVEALLAKAPVVEVLENCKLNGKQYWRTKDINDPENSGYTARLVGIQPIVRDTKAELIRWAITQRPHDMAPANWMAFVERLTERLKEVP